MFKYRISRLPYCIFFIFYNFLAIGMLDDGSPVSISIVLFLMPIALILIVLPRVRDCDWPLWVGLITIIPYLGGITGIALLFAGSSHKVSTEIEYMRRRTLVIITIVTIIGVYAGIYYLYRIRGYDFPIANGLAWRITEPPHRVRKWIGIDLRWRKLVARSWETGSGGYVKVQRDGRAEFSLDSYHYDGTGVFGAEWPDDTNHDMAHSLGFTMQFTQDGVRFWLELHPQKDEDGIMRGNGIEARIYRMADDGRSGGYEVYNSCLK